MNLININASFEYNSMRYSIKYINSEKRISFGEIKKQIETTRLTAGSDNDWEDISISGPSEISISILSRIAAGSEAGNSVINKLKEGLSGAYPASAREWIKKYLSRVKTIYAFQLLTENLTTDAEWRTLGQIQNLLKDQLGGIIQSDHEGYFNENGDYILWQMYGRVFQ
jgi:hypothetical protein